MQKHDWNPAFPAEDLCVTCCDSPYQRHQAQLDGTAPAPHDQHQPKRLTDHETLVQRGGLLQPNRKHNTQPASFSENSNLLWQNNTLDWSSWTECSECNLRIILKIWRSYFGKCMFHQVSFYALRLHPLPQVVDGIKCLILDKNQLRHNRLKPRLEQRQTCQSQLHCASDLTEPRLLQTSPCEGLFQERLQSRTGVPPTSGLRPPAVLAWSSQRGCVRTGRLSWPSLSDPYTP